MYRVKLSVRWKKKTWIENALWLVMPWRGTGAAQERLEAAQFFEEIWKKFKGRLVDTNRERS